MPAKIHHILQTFHFFCLRLVPLVKKAFKIPRNGGVFFTKHLLLPKKQKNELNNKSRTAKMIKISFSIDKNHPPP